MSRYSSHAYSSVYLQDRLRRNSFSFKARAVSQSAPLFPENKLDPAEKMRHMQPSLSRKFHSYVLPTPIDTNNSVSTGPGNAVPQSQTVQTKLSGRTQNLWHSSPLEPNNEKIMGDKKPAGPTVINAQSVLRESNNNIASHRLPPPLAGHMLFTGLDPLAAFDSKKIKRQAFSGPLISKHSSSKPVSAGSHQMFSGPLLRNPVPQPPSVSPPKVSPNTSPTFLSSPKISELHELPRPPVGLTSKSSRPLVGHSAPLAPRGQMQSTASKPPLSPTAAPLPTPPQTIPRSFSIPSRSPRVTELHVSKSHEAFPVPENSEDVASPPLSPIALSNTPKKS